MLRFTLANMYFSMPLLACFAVRENSPLFSASMIELTKAPSSAAVANSLACDPLSGGGTDEEAAGGIANMRVVNAAKVLVWPVDLLSRTNFALDRQKASTCNCINNV